MKPKRKPVIFLYKILGFVLTSLSLSYSSRTCRRLLEQARRQPYELGIVPGLPYTSGNWSLFMKARVYWAKYLFDQGLIRNAMFSGGAVHSPYVEGEIMALYAVAIGFPEKNVFVERNAEHSTENILYSYKLAKKLGFERIVVASDPFQSKLLRKFTRKKVSPDIGLIPVIYDILNRNEHNMHDPSIDAQKALVEDFVSLRGRESFRTRLKGTLGRNIDHRLYE